jgi:signal transduction histidine kinase
MLNGVDAMNDMKAGGELTIKSQTQSGQLLISVTDIRVGLPPRRSDQIFSAFFTTKLQGTGMGLSISGSIVESHGGRLWAADNTPRGAIFPLTLPTKDEAQE